MEDGFGDMEFLFSKWSDGSVLILVVMEDGLGEERFKEYKSWVLVLILVVMEDGLGDKEITNSRSLYMS